MVGTLDETYYLGLQSLHKRNAFTGPELQSGFLARYLLDKLFLIMVIS